jgi:YfiH family protein
MNKLLSFKLPFGYFTVLSELPQFPHIYCKQVHGTNIIRIQESGITADGICGNISELMLPWVIKTADCLPILLQGNNEWIFLHAGWRGLANGILKTDKVKQLNPSFAFIGPSISSECFEVSEDFKQNFPNSGQFYKCENKYHFDLKAFAREELKKMNPQIEIWDSQVCTFKDEKLASYRRDKNEIRNWNIFSINEVNL